MTALSGRRQGTNSCAPYRGEFAWKPPHLDDSSIAKGLYYENEEKVLVRLVRPNRCRGSGAPDDVWLCYQQ